MNYETDTNSFGIVSYIACCLIALLCWAIVGYAEVLSLQHKTEARIQAIDQAVQQMDRIARK